MTHSTISGNKGTFSNYTTTFEPQTLNPNGLTSIGIFSPMANFADLDNDGDLDLLSGGRGTNFSITLKIQEAMQHQFMQQFKTIHLV